MKHSPDTWLLMAQYGRAALGRLTATVARTVSHMRTRRAQTVQVQTDQVRTVQVGTRQVETRPVESRQIEPRKIETRPRVAKRPEDSLRKLKHSLRPRVALEQRIGAAVGVLILIAFRTATQLVLVAAIALGLCFVPEVNARVPQTKEFSATAASWIERTVQELRVNVFAPRAEAVQPPPTQRRPTQFRATQAVLVTSNPVGATVRLGGRTVGTTPLTLRVAPGTLTITLSRSGYATVTRTITVKLGKPALVGVTLAETRGTPPPPVTPLTNPSVPEQTPQGPDLGDSKSHGSSGD